MTGDGENEMTGDGENSISRRFMVVYSSPNIVRVMKSRKNELGGACSTNGVEEMGIEGTGEET
jgi:hypothetical protein